MPRIYLSFLSIFCWSLLVSGQDYRLPETVIPSHYEVTIDTDLTVFTFTGSVTITISATRATNSITLHSKDLQLSNIHLGSSAITVTNHEFQEAQDFLIINLSGNLIAGQNYQLSIDFSGELGIENVGYYRASYPDEEGNTRNLAITHLESTNARRAFPCFDQPNFKATFKFYLIRDLAFITTANMFILTSLEDPTDYSKIVDTYEITPIMSTYLIAFSVSDYIRDFDAAHPGYSVFGRRELIQRGEGKYALAIGEAVIDAMHTYTGVPYGLISMDQVAVPNDFYRIGAMENWGMVTYRERYLMYNEDTSTTAEKRTTATLIAHEFAHQWFGDLVTPQWWKYIWLNEGFATYFEMVIIDILEPEWKLMDQFLTSVLHPALNADSVLSTTSMTKDAESPAEIQNLYDTIVYEKAGSVLRMVHAFLGETVFKAGINTYLTDWSYSNVEPENLYSSWQEALNDATTNVAEILQKWETQKGYPVVTITRNYGGSMVLRQQKFLVKEPLDDGYMTWPIPINFMYSVRDDFDFSSTSPDIWFTALTRIITDESPESFLIANKGVTGFYRVNYDVTNWNNIIAFLTEDEFTKILLVNRAQLLDDAFNLARAGRLGYETALQLSTYIIRETEYVPLTTYFNAARFLNTMLLSSDDYLNFKDYLETLLTPISEDLDFEDATTDTQHQRLNRINVMNFLCDIAGGECRQRSLASFRQWKTGVIASLKPDSQLYTYCGALREGDQIDWDFLFEKYQVDNSDTHRTRILNALGCSENIVILTRLLDMTLDPEVEFFKSADRQTAFASVYSSGGIGLNLAFNYVKSKFTDINQSTLNLNTIITGLSSRLSTQAQLTEFIALLQSVSAIVPQSTRDAARKNVEDNVSWSSSNIPVISGWLREYLGIGVSSTPTTTEGDEEPEPTSSSTVEELSSTTVETTTADGETVEPEPTSSSTVEEISSTTVETTTADGGTVEPEPTASSTVEEISSTTVETTTADGGTVGVSFVLSVLCLLSNVAFLK